MFCISELGKINGGLFDQKGVIVDEKREKSTYTIDELKDILGIGRHSVMNLLQKKEFRWIRLDGGRYRISKKSFDDWLDKGPSL